MSGVELIGLASSILQIADLDWKLSYKLYAFSKKIHEAGKTIELISQDISATGAILKQLGDEVGKDEKAKPNSKLCSQRLIDAASQLVGECKELFGELDASSGGKDGHKVILGFRQKLKWSYLEPRVELLRTNLERLKSSLAIMLNVLIYAEQLRSREDKAILTEQQALVASFAAQKAETENKIEKLSRSIEFGLSLNCESRPGGQDAFEVFATSTDNAKNNLRPLTAQNSYYRDDVSSAPRPSTVETATREPLPGPGGNYNTTANVAAMFHIPLSGSAAEPRSSTTSATKAASSLQTSHLEQHRVLIEKLLEEVNSSRYAIDHGVRYRLHDGVLDLHWQEWAPLRSRHGDDIFRELLAQSPVLARHWHERVIKTKMSISSLQNHAEGITTTSTILSSTPAPMMHQSSPTSQTNMHSNPIKPQPLRMMMRMRMGRASSTYDKSPHSREEAKFRKRQRPKRSYSSSVSRSPPRRSRKLKSVSRSRTRSSTTPTRAAPLKHESDFGLLCGDDALVGDNHEETTGAYSPNEQQINQAGQKTFASLSSLGSEADAHVTAYDISFLEAPTANEGMRTTSSKSQIGPAVYASSNDMWTVPGLNDNAENPGIIRSSLEKMDGRAFTAGRVAQPVADPYLDGWVYPIGSVTDNTHVSLAPSEPVSVHNHGLSCHQPQAMNSYDRWPFHHAPDSGDLLGVQPVSKVEGPPIEPLFVGRDELGSNSELKDTASEDTWFPHTTHMSFHRFRASYAPDDHAANNMKDLQYSRDEDTDEEQASMAERRRLFTQPLMGEACGGEDMSLDNDETSSNISEGSPRILSFDARREAVSHLMCNHQLSSGDDSICSGYNEFQEQAIAANITNRLAQWTTIPPPLTVQ